MAPAAIWVQFVRNLACNVRTFVEVAVPGGRESAAALTTTLNNYVIAPTHGLAAFFNLVNGASDVGAGLEQVGRFSAWSQALASSGSASKTAYGKILKQSVQTHLTGAYHRVLAGVIQLVFAGCFIVLGSFTVKDAITFDAFLGPQFAASKLESSMWHALFIMDIGLVYFLWVMWEKYTTDVRSEKRLNKLAELLDTTVFGSRTDARTILDLCLDAGFTQETLPEAYLSMMPSSYKPIWLNSTYTGSASLQRALACIEDGLSGFVEVKSYKSITMGRQDRSNAAYKLHILAHQASNAQLPDLVFFLLNAVAGYGYLLGILASKDYFPAFDSRGGKHLEHLWHTALKLGYSHDASAWWGNLAGDIAWTVEPLLIIVSAFFSEPIQIENGEAVKASTTTFAVTSTTPNHRGRGRASTPTPWKTVASPSPSPRASPKASPKATTARSKSSSKAKKA